MKEKEMKKITKKEDKGAVTRAKISSILMRQYLSGTNSTEIAAVLDRRSCPSCILGSAAIL